MGSANQITEAELREMGTPEPGIQYVLDVYHSPPARKVGRRRRRNLVLDVPMRHLGVKLQAESLSGEYLFLVELDRRNDLKAVYDQPLSVPLQIVDAAGRRTRISYTADYLVIEPDCVRIYEVKADSDLEDLCRKRPGDWQFDAHGYHYLPAIAYFAKLGIEHITVQGSSLSAIRADNLRLLASSRQKVDTRHQRKMRDVIRKIVEHEGAIKAGLILDRIDEVDATAILQLIDMEVVFAALDVVSLSDIREIWIAASQQIANSLQECDQQLTAILKPSSSIESNELINPKYYAEVATRLAIVDGTFSKDHKGRARSLSSMRRYKKAFAAANGDPKALTPNWSKCGNRDSRISEVHRSFICQTIHEGRSDNQDRSTHRCYQDYIEAFDYFKCQTGLMSEVPVARSTYFRLRDRTGNASDDAYLKGGRRLQNAQSDAYDPSTKTVIATRAFTVAHIDHWKVDLFVLVGYINGKKVTARPWLTAMVDAYSGEVLALWLSFSSPSKKSCAMVIRDCVRRHGRLPEMIITDGGADFKSNHFSLMLATFGVTRCERPPEDPRFGQEVERLFGYFKERFARGLPGFGLSIEQARSVSGALKAHKHAKLGLIDAYFALEAYTFDGYNLSPKPGFLHSRLDIRSRSIATFPTIGRCVTWNLKFLIATSIESPDSKYTLWPGRGVHVFDQWYTSPHLISYRGYKKHITVRIEPYDMAIIYVCIEGRWFVCCSSKVSFHNGLSDRRRIDNAIAFHDLRSLRKELEGEMDREAAKIVAEKLDEISRRQAKSDGKSGSQSTSEADGIENDFSVSFDDIQPLDESNEP